jgi:hypothetical protein
MADWTATKSPSMSRAMARRTLAMTPPAKGSATLATSYSNWHSEQLVKARGLWFIARHLHMKAGGG